MPDLDLPGTDLPALEPVPTWLLPGPEGVLAAAAAHGGWEQDGTAILETSCAFIDRSGGQHLATVMPGDLLNRCTASAVYRCVRVDPGDVAVLVTTRHTPGYSWTAGNHYRVHLAHLQHAPQHDSGDLFATLTSAQQPRAADAAKSDAADLHHRSPPASPRTGPSRHRAVRS